MPRTLDFHQDGAQRARAALSEAETAALLALLAKPPSDQAGVRLFGAAGLGEYLGSDGVIGALASNLGGAATHPVRAILFDKTATANWSLGWHQDRVIAVQERIEVEGFGPWTRKQGAPHVAPPFDLLRQMITVRVHLDPVPATNAPLLHAPGSHRLGRIAEADVPAVVAQCGVATCCAESGDVWLYATPILHASERASTPARRRVLQIDYAAFDLPGGLQWLGV